MSGSGSLSPTGQFSVFKSSLERSRLVVKMAQAKRMEADLAALNEKYDGKKAAGIEDQINGIANRKFDVSNYLTNVETGLKRVDDIRTQLLMAKDAISKGSNDAFNLAINTVNLWVGRQADDPDSLIANNNNGRGAWRQDITVVDDGSASVEMAHQFMGTDYTILLNDGSVLRPNKDGTQLTGIGNGGVPFANLAMTRGANLTDANGNSFSGFVKVSASDGSATLVDAGGTALLDGDGNPIQGTLATTGGVTTLTDSNGKAYTLAYSDQVVVTQNDGGTTTNYTGTLKQGGLGLMHAWTYGNFKNDADPDAAATARQAASMDIDTAIRKLAQIERTLNIYQAGLSGISNDLDGKSSALADEYKKVSDEELTAKQAERRAIETRFQVATNAMSLSNETTATFVYQMFVNSPTYEKKSLTDVLLGSAGY